MSAHEIADAGLSHLQSVATSAGLLLFGVALGVKWAAVRTSGVIPATRSNFQLISELNSTYNQAMTMALVAAGVCLLLGVVTIMWEDTIRDEIDSWGE